VIPGAPLKTALLSSRACISAAVSGMSRDLSGLVSRKALPQEMQSRAIKIKRIFFMVQ